IRIDSFSLGVGPVEMASYLHQEGIANHTDDNQIEYSDDKRWAEPLDSNVSQVLLSNLTILLPNQIIYPFPWKISQSPDYQVLVDIRRFGWYPNNRVALNARVIIEDNKDVIVFSGEQNIEFTAPESSYQSVVATHNQLLERLSLRLVEILIKVIPQE
ncbi:MAG: PqiC family protein, partial [Arenicellales bacterium]